MRDERRRAAAHEGAHDGNDGNDGNDGIQDNFRDDTCDDTGDGVQAVGVRAGAHAQAPGKVASRRGRADGWKVQKQALQDKFPEGWQPRKRLSPDALEGIRALHRQFPDVYTTPALAKHFMVSAEAVRRILKSRWQPQPEEEEDRQDRWFKRGKQVWTRWAALGRKPPKRWQAEGIRRDASWAGRRQRQLAWQKGEGEGEEEGRQGADGQKGEGQVADGQKEEDGADGQKEDERERSAAATRAIERQLAGLDADGSDAAEPHTSRRGRTQSQGRWTRLQRETR